MDIDIFHLGLGQRSRIQAVQKLLAFRKGVNVERIARGTAYRFPLLVSLQKIGGVWPVYAGDKYISQI